MAKSKVAPKPVEEVPEQAPSPWDVIDRELHAVSGLHDDQREALVTALQSVCGAGGSGSSEQSTAMALQIDKLTAQVDELQARVTELEGGTGN